ncbi:MAG: sel1 repeat family protein [Sulfurovum sp.]|nr:sel1 repeat family protein [Sulfurovum sp.]
MKKVTNVILTASIVLMMGGCANTSKVSMASQPTSYIESLKQNCDAGIGKDCRFLAFNYDDGKDIKQDYSLAAHYYHKAISLGDVNSYGLLASLYTKGLGVKKDYYKAAKLYEKSSLYHSNIGVRNEARCNLGNMYKDGQGVKQSYFKAAKLYRKACNNNHYAACNNLGVLYRYGKGVRQNTAKAKRLYGKACDGGDNLGCKNYTKIKKESRRFNILRKPSDTLGVIESRVDGQFSGWEGETVVKLMNGQIWKQSSYHYHYHYAYMPNVLIYRSNGGYKMKVSGTDKGVGVMRLK